MVTAGTRPKSDRTSVLLDGLGFPGLALAEALLPDQGYVIVEVIGNGRQIGEDLGSMLGYGAIGLRVLSRSVAGCTPADMCVLTAGGGPVDFGTRARWALDRRMDVVVQLTLGHARPHHAREAAVLHDVAVAAARTLAFVEGDAQPGRSIGSMAAAPLLRAMSSIKSAPPGVLAEPS